MHTKNTYNKTDPFSVCVELAVYNLSVKKPSIKDSIYIRLELSKNNRVINDFVRYTDIFFTIAKVIDQNTLDIRSYFEITHPGNYVYNPKYFLRSDTFKKIQDWIKTTKQDQFETLVVLTVKRIIQKCVDLKYPTFSDFVMREIIRHKHAIYSSPMIAECLANKMSIYAINVLTRNFYCLSFTHKVELQSMFDTKSYYELIQKAYNIINMRFGSVTNAIKLINSEIYKRSK